MSAEDVEHYISNLGLKNAEDDLEDNFELGAAASEKQKEVLEDSDAME